MNKQPSRIGLYLILIALLVGGYFYLNSQVSGQNDYTIEALEQAAEEGRVNDAVIYQNREVPTGSVAADIENEGQKRVYVTDVKEAQEMLEENNIAPLVKDVPQQNVFLTTLFLPLLLTGGLILFLFLMMNRQMSGGGGNAKMMNFGKSRARMMLPDDKKVTFQNVAGLQEEKEDAEQKMFILAEKVDQYRDDEETLKTALLNAQRMGESVIHEARQKAETIIYDANSKASQLKNEADASVAASQAELERLKKEVAQFKSTVLELYRQHIASLTNVPGEETLKPAQKPEAKQPAAEPPAAQQAEKKQPGKPRAKKEKQADVPPAGQAPMYDYDEDRPDAPAHSGDAMFGNYKGITFED